MLVAASKRLSRAILERIRRLRLPERAGATGTVCADHRSTPPRRAFRAARWPGDGRIGPPSSRNVERKRRLPISRPVIRSPDLPGGRQAQVGIGRSRESRLGAERRC